MEALTPCSHSVGAGTSLLGVLCCLFSQQGLKCAPHYERAEMWSPWCPSWSQVRSRHPQCLMKDEKELCALSCVVKGSPTPAPTPTPTPVLRLWYPPAAWAGEKETSLSIASVGWGSVLLFLWKACREAWLLRNRTAIQKPPFISNLVK